jgi:hypothetical protein
MQMASVVSIVVFVTPAHHCIRRSGRWIEPPEIDPKEASFHQAFRLKKTPGAFFDVACDGP